ncbi:MAG: polysulfide reductase NrfD [Desulfatiglans sp.]|nr:polysulfide reductase NrfD [Desulfatiglans sp.]
MLSNANNTAKSILTPFNLITGAIVLVGLVLTLMRFTGGLARVSNLTDYNPWGLWIGLDLLTGVALAAGGFVSSAAVYIFGLKKYHAAVRPAILTAFLGYALVVVALNYDVGIPWRLPYPFIMQQGTTSVLFEVGLCVFLYLTVLFLEFSPAALEWLGMRKLRNLVHRLTVVLTILGVILSTLHQSSLGALFLIAPSKLHPLWYSSYLPVYFFISAIIAGLSMVLFEGAFCHHFFADKLGEAHRQEKDQIALGFGKAASWVLAGYFAIKVFGISADNNWHYLLTGYGLWYLVELLGFVLLPCLLYATGVRGRRLTLIRWTAGWTVLGIIINRLNICIIAFNWHLPASERYFPHWMEIGISVFLLTCGLIVFKFIVSRMPVLYSHPEYKETH